MRNSFRLKWVAVFLVGIIISMFAMTFLSSVLLRPVFISNSKKTMEEYAVQIDTCLKGGAKDIEKLLEEINISYGITTHIADESGKIHYSYTKMRINKSLSQKYSKWIALYYEKDIDENYYFRQRTDESDMVKKIIYVGKASDGKFIIMNKAIKGIDQDVKLVSFFIMIMGVTVAVIGTAVWSIFTKSFTDSIMKMSRITRKMSELNFDEKINHKSNDEIGILANSIDVLSDELKESIKGLKDDVERQKRLVRDISHELKTPVTTVKGYIENIQFLTEGNEKLTTYCKIAAEECDEIDSLVEEMLEMSRLENEGYICDMEETDTSAIANAILNKLETEFREYSFDTYFAPATVKCNSVLISRAVLNFIKNAVKHGKPGSEIQLRGEIEDGLYFFKVTNEGTAIPEEEKEHIWDLFYKNDKSRKRNNSHGIGLSMVRQIVSLHSGKVGIECKDGKNTFYFSLSIIEPENI